MADTAEDWRKKCEKSEENLQKLKNLSVNAVRDYEDLQRKYDQNQKQYDDLRKRLEETENELHKVESVLPNALDEYDRVQKEAEIEKHCRVEAEKYARKVYKQNDQLKRQSAMLLDKLGGGMSAVDISIEELGLISEGRESSMDAISVMDERENLYKMIDELKEQVLDLETKYKISERQRTDAIEKEAIAHKKYSELQNRLQISEKRLKEYESSLNKFKRTSMQVLEEHDRMARDLEREQALKLEAEKYAHQMLSQKTTAQRESCILLENVASDQQLMKAMLQIEDLQKALDEEKYANKTKTAELEAALKEASDGDKLSELEEQVIKMSEQLQEQKKHYQELEKWKVKLEKENKELIDKLDVADQRLNPPPPPPPPPPPVPMFQPLRKILGKKKKKDGVPAGKGVPAVDDDTAKAYQDMMDRIRSGNFTLRAPKQRRPSLPENMRLGENLSDNPELSNSAMEEMRGLLKGLKGKNLAKDMEPDESPPDVGLSELQKTFQRVRGQDKLPTIEEKTSGAKRTTFTRSQSMSS